MEHATFELIRLDGGPLAGHMLSPPEEHTRFALGARIRVEDGSYLVEGPAGEPLPDYYGRAVWQPAE